jgi:hypothetical protein
LSLASEQVGEKVMNLGVTQLLSILEDTVSRGTPTIHGMALYETSDGGSVCFVCRFCVADLQRSVVPKFALSMKWNVGVVLAELSGLTVLEQLLIMRRFHVVHVSTVHGSVGGGDLRFSSHAKPFLPPNHGYHAWALPLSDELQHCVLCIEFQRCLDLHISFLPFLHVRAG